MYQKVFQNLLMNSGITDYALFPHFFPASFKLRLDQSHHLAILRHERAQGRKNQLQRDKRYVDRGKIQWLWDLLFRQIAGVGPLQADYSLIASD